MTCVPRLLAQRHRVSHTGAQLIGIREAVGEWIFLARAPPRFDAPIAIDDHVQQLLLCSIARATKRETLTTRAGTHLRCTFGLNMRKSGVKFGLIGTASSLKKSSAGAGKGRPIGSKPAPRRRPPGSTSVFDANSDDEDEESKGDMSGVTAVNKRLAAISAKQEKQAKKEYEDALQADPSVFDYDRVYDGMKER